MPHRKAAFGPHPFVELFVAMVAMKLCGYVALWLCGYVAAWLCGYVAMWLTGFVAFLRFGRIPWSLMLINVLVPRPHLRKTHLNI